MTLMVILLIICLVLSAFFSGSEMAFVSSNQLRIRELAEKGHPAAKRILKLQVDTQSFLSTILIGNNIVNIVSTALLTVILRDQFGIVNEWVVTLILFPVMLIFCEMVPKDYCRVRSEIVLMKSAGPLSFVVALLAFPVSLIMRAVDSFLGRFKTVLHKAIFVSENEFRMLIEESAKSGVLEDHERQLVNTILDFEHTRTSSVMIPLSRVAKVSIEGTVKEVKEIAQKTGARMVLVYEEIPTLVVGMVYVFDLLFEEDENSGLKEYLRSPIFLKGSDSCEKAFLTLQQKRQSFAVVMDEFGETEGIVPIERLMEI